ncbi:porin family protein [Aquimarina sp. 2201CG5-10]|uniref:type IX secretion/gliding motility protein PorT/SprT n=1 Tax=Aquimarina callyspongiae TaxID=3098150 RepID=UPI002AB56204|nr:porin family protein [Aquimarina sp. 2201CG5-10]MDY8138816.1 porin family protein [Aquimarina sp. 2201CG5-10]
MKRLFIVIAILVGVQDMNAQLFSKERVQNLQNFDKPRLSWGYILGFNSYDFNFDYAPVDANGNFETDIIVKSSLGFNVGLLGNMRINEYLDLRLEPMVTFSQRNLTFVGSDFTTSSESLREVKSTYIHIPLLLKISTKRLNNFKPFVVGGISTSINLSSNEDNPDDNSAGEFRMKTNTNYYEIGFGIDFYLQYFKFTPSIRGIFAMSDELVRDNDPNSPYTSTIDKMSTRGIFINFTFQ